MGNYFSIHYSGFRPDFFGKRKPDIISNEPILLKTLTPLSHDYPILPVSLNDDKSLFLQQPLAQFNPIISSTNK